MLQQGTLSPVNHTAFGHSPHGVDGTLFWDLEDLNWVDTASVYQGWVAAGKHLGSWAFQEKP